MQNKSLHVKLSKQYKWDAFLSTGMKNWKFCLSVSSNYISLHVPNLVLGSDEDDNVP